MKERRHCDEERLLAFVAGELGPDQIELLERHLMQCATCTERVKVMALVEFAINEPVPEARHPIRFLLAAAALLLTIGALVLAHLWTTPEPTSALQALATSEAYPYFLLQTRADLEEGQAQKEAFTLYMTQDYTNAYRLLRELGDRDHIRFYRGVAAYMVGLNLAARRDLEGLVHTESHWRSPSEWYLANIDLRQEDSEAAKRHLENIILIKGEQEAKAVELLQLLSHE